MIKPPFYPTPPPKGAPRLERLLFLRKHYAYSATPVLLMLILGLALSVRLIIVAGVACLLVEASGAAALALQIRAERRKLSG